VNHHPFSFDCTSKHPARWVPARWIVVALTAVCTLLLVIEIQRPSYWIDEKISVDIASGASPRQVVENVIRGERRPPAYHLGLWAWMQLIGQSERAARLYSAAWIVLLAPATFQLTRRLFGQGSALLAVGLAVSAPAVIAYGQTVRYYGMVATLSALSYAMFLGLLKRPGRTWVLYALVTLALLYTDYPAYGIIAAQNVMALVWWNDRASAPHRPRWKWFALQVGLALAVSVWIPVVLNQSTRDLGAADLSNSLAGALLRVAYPFYAWVIGETLFPWSPLAIVGVLIASGVLLYGFIRLERRARLFWLVAFSAPFVVSQALLATVATDSPFVNAPARSMACAGLLYALFGAGLAAIRTRWLTVAALIALTATHGLALFNYYRGVDFINSVYNTPARDVASAIAAQAKPGDVVISESDSLIKVYLPANVRSTHFDAGQQADIEAYLAAHPVAVWQVTMGRDRTRNDVPANLSDWLKSRYTLCSSEGFAEQDATYRKLKSQLLGREAYRYRLTLNEYCP
jgi:hypothetical protein